MEEEYSQEILDEAERIVEDFLGESFEDSSQENILMAMFGLIATNERLVAALTSSDPCAIESMQTELNMDIEGMLDASGYYH
jgi:hypothetical protein